jgi:DNA mismatch endonuclease, patch repair protein
MVDVVDKATRSRMMSGIRGKHTRPEMALRRALHRLGLRFRLHERTLPGRPDIVFARHRAVVQVHGCFWHRHPGCRYASSPAENQDFWEEKFKATVLRDQQTEIALAQLGWRTSVVWECTLRKNTADAIAAELKRWIEDEKRVEFIPENVDLAVRPKASKARRPNS